MSILKLASLVVTANAYEESKILAVVPSNGSGDLDFVRASTKSRVNSDGFIEDLPYNLLRYSEDFSSVVWDKGNGASIVSNQAISPTGTLTADKYVTSGLADPIISQVVNNTIATKTFTFSVWIWGDTNIAGISNLYMYGDGTEQVKALSFNVNTTPTKYVLTGTFNASAVSTRLIARIDIPNNSSNGTYFYVWGAQLVQGSLEKPYFPTTDRLNVPSIDYTGGGCPSILLEPQRTNLLTYSGNFENNVYAKDNCTVINTTITSPFNAQVSSKIIEDSSLLQHRVSRQFFTTIGNKYTFSFYIKEEERRYGYVRMNRGSGNDNLVAFDIRTQSITFLTPTIDYKILKFNNGWIRVSVTFAADKSAHTLYLGISSIAVTTNDNPSYQGNGVSGFYIDGFQLEEASYSTSYIPTQASAVTRITDTFRKNNIFTNNFITSLGGTWFVEFKNNIPLFRDGAGTGLNLSANGGYSPGLLFKQSNNNSLIRLSALDDNSIESTVYVTTQTTSKVIIKWNGFNLNVFENGIKVVSNYPFTQTLLNVLDCSGLTTTINLSSLALFPTPLSDEECILLSSTSYNTYQEMATALNYINQ
jgi:hypothetical protein